MLLRVRAHGAGHDGLGGKVLISPVANHEDFHGGWIGRQCASQSRHGSKRSQRTEGEALAQEAAAGKGGEGGGRVQNRQTHIRVIPLSKEMGIRAWLPDAANTEGVEL